MRQEIWSFFSGAMGLDLGLDQAGLAPTLANELDAVCCRTIRLNRPDLDLIEGSICNVNGAGLRRRRRFDGEVYLMVGGPPCQSFSSGGKRAGLTDARGNLIYEYFRLIAEVRPRYFVMENVANLATAALRHRPIADRPGKHWNLRYYERPQLAMFDGVAALQPDEMAGSALRQIVSDVGGLGYHVRFAVIDAADYGAPQHRLRFVMLGSQECPPPALPQPVYGEGRQPYRTVREVIEHLKNDPGAHSEYTAPVRGLFSLIPPGGNWRSLPPSLHREALGGAFDAGGGKTGFLRRLAWDTPSPTITGRANRKGSALCHPDADRPLSVKECAAIQGFPSEWVFSGAMNSQYMQIGNAVPVPLGLAAGQAILAHAAGQTANVPARQLTDDFMISAAIGRLRAAGRNKRQARAA